MEGCYQLEVVAGSAEVALRNEEINRRRMQASRSNGGPLKITDHAALTRLINEMKLKSEQQKAIEQQREAERAKREGAAYKPKEEREREAKDAKEEFEAGNEARSLDRGKLDPKRDYYAALGLDRAASVAQIRKAYKRLALLYHPDKHKAEGEEQQAAVAARFREVFVAFDVLVNEEQRGLYDKVRDHMEANPGKGLPPLSPEEAAMMRTGAGELSRLRRSGPKLGKHPPLEKEVFLALPKLNTGCTKTVSVELCRVDYSGQAFVTTKTFHLVVRRGSREGDRHVFEDEGEETIDTHPGDLILTLRAKPHPALRRKGDKDLEMFAAAVPPGDVIYAAEVETIYGEVRLLRVPALAAALERGGVGGVWKEVLAGRGLYDAKEPWEGPAGDMVVQLRYPPVLLAERSIVSCLRLAPVHLLGSSSEMVSAAMVGGVVAAALRHRAEALHMCRDYQGQPPRLTAVSLTVLAGQREGQAQQSSPGMAAAAVLSVLESRVAGLQATAATFVGGAGLVDDAAWCALHEADALILDLVLPAGTGREEAVASARRQLEEAGFMQLLWARAWCGCHIIAADGACALLGAACQQLDPTVGRLAAPVLPWYILRTGDGESAGWEDIHVAVGAAPAGMLGVGLLCSSACAVDPVTGAAELLVVPRKEALIAAARWRMESVAELAGLQEAGDDFGFFYARQKIG